MTHELLAICGPDGDEMRKQRLSMLEHAVLRVPNMSSYELLQNQNVAAALVVTSHVGGTFAESDQGRPGGAYITIATTRMGLSVAKDPHYHGHDSGSEAGHISLKLLQDGSVAIGTDGVAYIPSFWAEQGQNFYFSTHLASLVSLGVRLDIDEQGLVEYLTMLHPLDKRTLLSGVHLTAPGTSLTWDHGTGLRRKSQPLFVPTSEVMSDEEAISTFGSVWRDVISDMIQRNSSDRLTLALSGGLDSRAVAHMMAGMEVRPISYTYGSDRNREVVVASQVAGQLRLPHLKVPVTDDRILSNLRDNSELLDGAHSPAEMYESWFADLLRTFSDVVINGLAGGPLWGDDKSLGLTDHGSILDKQFDRQLGSLDAITKFLGKDIVGHASEVFRAGLDKSMAQWDFSQRADMVTFWRMSNRQLRWGNMLINALRRVGLRPEAPFLDSRFLRFCRALTASQRRNGNLYLRAHREVFSETAAIARSDDGNSPRHLNHVYWSGDTTLGRQLAQLSARHPGSGARRATWRAADVAAAKALERLGIAAPANTLEARKSAFPADMWFRTRPTYRHKLATLLESAPPHPLLSAETLDRTVSELRAGTSNVSPLAIARVGTANVWLDDYEERARAVRAEKL